MTPNHSSPTGCSHRRSAVVPILVNPASDPEPALVVAAHWNDISGLGSCHGSHAVALQCRTVGNQQVTKHRRQSVHRFNSRHGCVTSTDWQVHITDVVVSSTNGEVE